MLEELTLDELLADPVMELLMRSDGVSVEALLELVARVREELGLE